MPQPNRRGNRQAGRGVPAGRGGLRPNTPAPMPTTPESPADTTPTPSASLANPVTNTPGHPASSTEAPGTTLLTTLMQTEDEIEYEESPDEDELPDPGYGDVLALV